MSDVLERLDEMAKFQYEGSHHGGIYEEAANEIRRLRSIIRPHTPP